MKEIFLNKSINTIAIHRFFWMLGWQTMTFLWPVVMYKIGISLPFIFLALWLIFFLRLIIRPFVSICINYYGLKTFLILWIILRILSYIPFLLMDWINIYWFLFVWLTALAETIYFFAYHIYYSICGDNSMRWRHNSIIDWLHIIAIILWPVLVWAMTYFYWINTFFISWIIFHILALIPIFFLKDIVYKKSEISIKNIKKEKKRGFFISASSAFMEVSNETLRALILFLIFKDIFTISWIISWVLFLWIFIKYMVWKSVDKKENKKWYLVGTLIIVAWFIARIFLWYTTLNIIIIDLFLILWISLYWPYRNIVVYNDIKLSKRPWIFTLISETWYDLAAISICLLISLYCFFLPEHYLKYTLILWLLLLPIENYIYYKYQKDW